MRPLITLETMTTPDGQVLELRCRDDDFYLMLGGEELMSSRNTGSERALAELVLAECANRARPRILIGGLGIGYTLQAALSAMPKRGRAVVAELFGEVVEWNRRHLAHLHGHSLSDHRASVVTEDVATVIAQSRPSSWDAILLDVDNGPDAFCLESNARLYSDTGLDAIRRALCAGGVLGIWSASADTNRGFQKRLRRAGFDARFEPVRSRGRKGFRQGVFLAKASQIRAKATRNERFRA